MINKWDKAKKVPDERKESISTGSGPNVTFFLILERIRRRLRQALAVHLRLQRQLRRRRHHQRHRRALDRQPVPPPSRRPDRLPLEIDARELRGGSHPDSVVAPDLPQRGSAGRRPQTRSSVPVGPIEQRAPPHQLDSCRGPDQLDRRDVDHRETSQTQQERLRSEGKVLWQTVDQESGGGAGTAAQAPRGRHGGDGAGRDRLALEHQGAGHSLQPLRAKLPPPGYEPGEVLRQPESAGGQQRLQVLRRDQDQDQRDCRVSATRNYFWTNVVISI
jgi:hypothetical protein